jgi:hypothetical protein
MWRQGKGERVRERQMDKHSIKKIPFKHLDAYM